MRFPSIAMIAICCIALGASAAAFACGGGDDESGPPDASKIPTATLPPNLPEPILVGGGVVVPGGTNSYTIKEGDTLDAIATRFGLSLDDLLAENPDIEPRTLRAGDTIRLPGDVDAPVASATLEAEETAAPEPTEKPEIDTPVPAATDTPGPTNTPSTLGQTYTVQAGDIPLTIAEKFGITVEALQAANPGMDSRGLQIGQVLVIPPPPSEGG